MKASSLRQNGPCFVVRTDANIPAKDGSPRAVRQPAAVERSPVTVIGAGDTGDNSLVRASIQPTWRMFRLIATHLQEHLDYSNLTSAIVLSLLWTASRLMPACATL